MQTGQVDKSLLLTSAIAEAITAIKFPLKAKRLVFLLLFFCHYFVKIIFTCVERGIKFHDRSSRSKEVSAHVYCCHLSVNNDLIFLYSKNVF